MSIRLTSDSNMSFSCQIIKISTFTPLLTRALGRSTPGFGIPYASLGTPYGIYELTPNRILRTSSISLPRIYFCSLVLVIIFLRSGAQICIGLSDIAVWSFMTYYLFEPIY